MAQVTGIGVPAPASEALGDSGLASRKGEAPQTSPARTAVEADLGDEDVRGQAGVTPQGTVVRAHKGSKRPSDIDPYVWAMYSRKQRADEVARYERELEERREKDADRDRWNPSCGCSAIGCRGERARWVRSNCENGVREKC